MTEIISVRFSNRGKAYYFDPAGLVINKGDHVVVETSKGLEYGECTYGNRMVNDDSIIKPLRPVIRVATEADSISAQNWKEKEKDAFGYCQKKISEFGLDMKLVDVEYGFEGNKILFFFTSEGRVDFRELVKDLAAEFRARIELRQIGVRDEAKMLGGLGVCGKQFCCSQFLSEFHPVSIKMAKTQGLSLNPAKISGTCGRLMGCLKYEDAAYENLVKKAPKIDAFVETPSGKGTVININLLRGNAKVRLEEGLDTTLKSFSFDELDVLGGKGRRAEYIAAKEEGRLQEAGFSITPQPEEKPVLDRTNSAEQETVQTNSIVTQDSTQTTSPAARNPHRTNASDHSTSARSRSPRQNNRRPQSDTGKRHTPAASDTNNSDNKNPSEPAQTQQSSNGTQRSSKQYFRRNNNRNNRNNRNNNNKDGQDKTK